jgi:site-specific DNA-methyltransferase (adenine-specific)
MIAWMYGSGFPKSLDVSKALDKAAGVEPLHIGANPNHRRGQSLGHDAGVAMQGQPHTGNGNLTAPATDEAKQWQGWGTALKPAMEPITMARKPFKGTVADNVQAYGTGAINIDGCRIACDDGFEKAWDRPISTNIGAKGGKFISEGVQHKVDLSEYKPSGRWPANVLHDGCDDVLRGMGEAARFFYTPKACKEDRDDGCEMMEARQYSHDGRTKPLENAYQRNESEARNFHPTVKPTDLMRYLCRMVTPPGGIVLDPFTGSGSTGRGAVLEGFRFIGCEMDADYIEIAKARILAAEKAYQPCLTFD